MALVFEELQNAMELKNAVMEAMKKNVVKVVNLMR
jgi:hypothetical protein